MQIKDLMKQHNLSPADAVSGGRKKSVKQHRDSVIGHINKSIKILNKGETIGTCVTWCDGFDEKTKKTFVGWNIKILMQSIYLLFDGKKALDFPDKTENKENVIGVLKGLVEAIKSGGLDTELEAHMKAIAAKREEYKDKKDDKEKSKTTAKK